jgi:hypothetical protein
MIVFHWFVLIYIGIYFSECNADSVMAEKFPCDYPGCKCGGISREDGGGMCYSCLNAFYCHEKCAEADWRRHCTDCVALANGQDYSQDGDLFVDLEGNVDEDIGRRRKRKDGRRKKKHRAKGLTARKARQILREGRARGKPLTEKQRRFFGWLSKRG